LSEQAGLVRRREKDDREKGGETLCPWKGILKKRVLKGTLEQDRESYTANT